jgi:hypothetical protein
VTRDIESGRRTRPQTEFHATLVERPTAGAPRQASVRRRDRRP